MAASFALQPQATSFDKKQTDIDPQLQPRGADKQARDDKAAKLAAKCGQDKSREKKTLADLEQKKKRSSTGNFEKEST